MIVSQPATNRWIPALSGYRALAALAVFVFHLVSVDPQDGTLGRLTVPLGNAAVCLFFVLSGFLIYRPFARAAFGVGPTVATLQFIVRRAARIFPLYWAVLTVHLFVFEAGKESSLGDLLTAYGLIQNFRGVLVFLPPFVAWSLCIELWFSFALPFLAGPLRRLGNNQPPRTILTVQFTGFLLMIAVAIVFREWAIEAPSSGRILWVPAYLDWFAGGLGLATWVTYRQEVIGNRASIFIPSPAMGTAIAVAAYWAVTQLGLPNGFETPSRFQIHLQFLLEPLAAVSLVAVAVWPGIQDREPSRFLSNRYLAWIHVLPTSISRLLSSRLFRWLGAVSYGIYLAHPLVIDEMIQSFPEASLLIIGPVGLVITLAVAYLLHKLVEIPASQAVDFLVGRASRSVAQISADDNDSVQPAPAEQHPSRVARLTRPSASWVLAGSLLLAFAVPFWHQRGRYVADARYELFADPFSRLTRIFSIWDPTRDLGRPAEEVWPGVTVFASALSSLGVAPWVIERAWHGTLLALALLGASKLARELAPTRYYSSLIVGLLYAFGPFSAIYLIPSTLYVNHVIAPWLAVAVIKASRRQGPLVWAAVVAMIVFAAGNADPPGLVFAAVPAISCMIGVFVLRSSSRKPLLQFGVAALAFTAVTSATMIVKTVAGASALGQRLIETEPATTVAASSSFTESVRGMGFWLLYFRLEPSVSRIHQAPLVEDWQMILFTLVPIVAGFALIASRLRQLPEQPASTLRSKCKLPDKPTLAPLAMAATWFVIGTVVMVGPYPTENPSRWGQFLLSLYDQSDIAFGFRSTHKAGVISALGVALLGGWALGEMARRRPDRNGGEVRWFLVGLVCFLVAGVAQPFWRTSLYSPTLTSEALPQYWDEVADWFESDPPQGRVLVLPGSTNNGYRWGSVGDDILDPIVPNRLVASMLPLSTPIAADVTDALDRHLTSADYRPGDFQSLARRFGVSHILIRNDLNWRTQGLSSPSDLDQLRSDPELLLINTFGPNDEVEVLTVRGAQRATTTLVPVTESRRQILVEGDGDATMRLSSTGVLRGGHPVRYASTVAADDFTATTQDTALVVIADTKLDRDRRTTYYGYNYALPEADRQGRLGSSAVASVATVELSGAKVSTTVDRWSAGTDNPPTDAIDADNETAWKVPPLIDPSGTTWALQLASPSDATELVIDLFDPANRVQALEILVDGRRQEHTLNNGAATADIRGKVEEISIEFTKLGPGSSTIGINEVTFGDDTPTAILTLPTRVSQLAATNPTIAANLEDAELLLSIGHAEFSTEPILRRFSLWRPDQFSIEARVQTTATEPYCSTDLIQINGNQVPIKVEPDLNGFGRIGFCEEWQRVKLGNGSYVISVTPDSDTKFSELRLTTMDELLNPLSTSSVDLRSPDLELNAGDLVITPVSYDQGWKLGQPVAATAMALNGLTGFEIVEPDSVGPIKHQAEGPLVFSLWLSGLGILACLATFVGSALGRRLAVFGGRKPLTSALNNADNATSKFPRLPYERTRPGLALMAVAVGFAWLTFGLMSAVGVALVAIVAMLFGAHRLWLVVAGVAIGLVADQLLHLVELTNADSGSKIAVALIGGVVVASAHRWKTPLLSELPANNVDNAVPREELPSHGNRHDPPKKRVIPGMDRPDLET